MAEDRAFDARCERRDGAVVVVARGELDLASADDLRTVLRGPEAQAETVVLDLRGVTFIDSSGLSVIVGHNRRAEAERVPLRDRRRWRADREAGLRPLRPARHAAARRRPRGGHCDGSVRAASTSSKRSARPVTSATTCSRSTGPRRRSDRSSPGHGASRRSSASSSARGSRCGWRGGPELTFFCNEAYRRDTLGKKYPWALGRPAREVWAEIWDDIGPRIEAVLRTGVATWDESLLLFLERSGYVEETYHTFSYSPLTDDAGAIVGMLCVVSEDTERVIGERRMATLRDLGSEPSRPRRATSTSARRRRHLETGRRSLPFAAIYLFEEDAADRAAGGHERDRRRARRPRRRVITAADPGPWPVAGAGRRPATAIMHELDRAFENLPTGDWSEPPTDGDPAAAAPARPDGAPVRLPVRRRQSLPAARRGLPRVPRARRRAARGRASPAPGRTTPSAAAPRSSPSSTGPRPRSSPTSATSCARR